LISIYTITEFLSCYVELFMFTLFNSTFLNETTFKEKLSKKIILTLIASCIMMAINRISLFSVIVLPLNILTAFSLEFLIYRIKPLKILALNITFILFNFLLDSISVRLLSKAKRIEISSIYEQLSLNRVVCIIISKMLLVFLILMINKLFNKNKRIRTPYAVTLFFISIIVCILTFSITFFEIRNNSSESTLSFLTYIVILILLVVIFFSMFGLTEAFEKSQELKLVKMKNVMLENAMIETESNFELWRKSVHDYKHNITNLTVLAEKNDIEEIKNYLKQQNELFSKNLFYYKTGNETVDAILYSKQQIAEKNNIPFLINAYISEKCPVKSAHFASILGNLIDNAIEASLNEKEPLIEIKLISEENKFWIIVSNRCTKKHKTLSTTKYDKHLHGIGLKSVESTVKEYDGDVNIIINDNTFKVRIYIPI